jgi:adenylate kinase family enzyme
MQRIVILGCSGSGKSTLARRMGDRLGLPVVHLDALFWLPGWVESDLASFRSRVAEAVAGDRWVCDGGYSRTYDLRFPFADTVIWLERPRWLCLWRVLKRSVSQLGRTRDDMAPGCPERLPQPKFLLFVWNWERVTRPKIEAGLARYAPTTPRVVLSSDVDVETFLQRLPSPSSRP